MNRKFGAIRAGYKECLTRERQFARHAALFPTGQSGMAKIIVEMGRVHRHLARHRAARHH